MSAIVDSARGLVPYGHLCWAYQDRVEFRARALEYMADGIAVGQWIEYVGSGSVEALRAELAGFDGIKQILDNGGIRVCSVGDFYEFSGHSDVVDPVGAVAARVIAAEEALAAGYTGFRAVIDATAVVRSPEQRGAFARFEHLIDRQMSVLPVTTLCAYDVSELGSVAVAELACLHPLASVGSTSFRLYAVEGSNLALAGEIDFSCTDLFDTTLGRTVPLSLGPELVVDGRRVEFINHVGLLAVDRYAREHNRKVVWRTTSSTVVRLAELLPLTALRVEVST